MCLQIHYLFPHPECGCLAKIGKYACYETRQKNHDSSRNFALSLQSTSSASVPSPFQVNIAPLFSKNVFSTVVPTKPITIKTLLSRHIDDQIIIARRDEKWFDPGCPRFKIVDQLLRTGDNSCYRCYKRAERRNRKEEEESKEKVGVWDCVEGAKGIAGGSTRGMGGRKGSRGALGEIERELMEIERSFEEAQKDRGGEREEDDEGDDRSSEVGVENVDEEKRSKNVERVHGTGDKLNDVKSGSHRSPRKK
ncbi:hypothetical protein BJ875DRAFT_498872 [Amylocarpus encephaloides]|uniref:Uncharacterized protein n=1 Tax=Amylocarpus encephaloides TaxID=45428 RepID=A0A9P8C388_9HELO|nr:hypothetical protein BJ875DRAFT_498872 [Amylocarpus encephaloides]